MADVSVLFAKFYYSQAAFLDGTSEFHVLCSEHIRPGSEILEIGSGPTNRTSRYLSALGTVTGIDVSGEVVSNTALQRALVYDGRRLPFAPGSFDACVSDYVMEHIEDPAVHFREVARVLRPGGVYCFRTPNLWHYVTMSSYLLPHIVHRKFANALRNMPPDAHEPWPTVYRGNTRRAIRRYCAAAGLEPVTLRMVEKEPAYGKASALLFFPMMAYERLVNTVPALAGLRVNIFGLVRKLV